MENVAWPVYVRRDRDHVSGPFYVFFCFVFLSQLWMSMPVTVGLWESGCFRKVESALCIWHDHCTDKVPGALWPQKCSVTYKLSQTLLPVCLSVCGQKCTEISCFNMGLMGISVSVSHYLFLLMSCSNVMEVNVENITSGCRLVHWPTNPTIKPSKASVSKPSMLNGWKHLQYN